MNSILDELIESLDDLSASILALTKEDRTLMAINGWTFPPLNRHDASLMLTRLSNKVKQYEISELDNEISEAIQEVLERISGFKKTILPQLFTGNANQVFPHFIALVQYVSQVLDPLFGWEILHDNRVLPVQLSRRLRAIQSELNELIPNKETIKEQIQLIHDATAAAESLPTDLESLKDARNKVNKFSTDAAEFFGKIDSYHQLSEKTSTSILDKREEVDKLIAQCEDAYKITTTKGLAGAFTQRANGLVNSMWIWVVGLLIALTVGVLIGAHRFEIINDAMNNKQSTGYIWIQIFLSSLSLGAPIWFAWIATKQISQRFKLSEDYAYKAAVAKAYEGYRKEAARIDPDFESRLFDSALTRLEEAPLRFMEGKEHGSPWHEMVSSPQFQRALESIPELRDKFIEITKSGISVLAKNSRTGKEIDV